MSITLVLHQKSTVVPRGQLAIALAQLMWGFPPDCYRGRGEGKLTRSIRSTGRNSALIDEARHVEETTVLCYHTFIFIHGRRGAFIAARVVLLIRIVLSGLAAA